LALRSRWSGHWVLRRILESNMKDMKRAIRRHHIKRLKQARKHYWGYYGPKSQWTNALDKAPEAGLKRMSPIQLGRVVQNPQACSCLGCSGNYERRYFGRRSIKELGFIALAKSEQ